APPTLPLHDALPIWQPRQGLELLQRGGLDGPHAAHLLGQALPAGLAQPGDVVEDAPGHPLAPALAVERDGEAVGLVADPLEEVQDRKSTRLNSSHVK